MQKSWLVPSHPYLSVILCDSFVYAAVTALLFQPRKVGARLSLAPQGSQISSENNFAFVPLTRAHTSYLTRNRASERYQLPNRNQAWDSSSPLRFFSLWRGQRSSKTHQPPLPEYIFMLFTLSSMYLARQRGLILVRGLLKDHGVLGVGIPNSSSGPSPAPCSDQRDAWRGGWEGTVSS